MSEHPLAARWRARRADGRPALVTYLTAGYPDHHSTVEAMHMLAEEGADVIELGVPFSDPLADGPTIQRSSHAALQGGTNVPAVLDMVREAGVSTPVVAFSYLNPILSYGLDRFVGDAAEAGVVGLLLTDLPAGADPDLESRLGRAPMPLIRLVAPTTATDRLGGIDFDPRGFVYLIARLGVTGAPTEVGVSVPEAVERVRSVTSLPVAVGFGIRGPGQAQAVAECADGVVVGSALVERLGDGISPARSYVRELRAALDDVHARHAGA